MIIASPLLTDLYQFTMASGYYELGMAETEAVFHLFYRKNPFKGNYAVAAGLAHVIEYLKNYQFNRSELDYLSSLKNPTGSPLFHKKFLDYLQKLKFTCDVAAIPEGQIIFPYEPLLRIQGPLLQCQLIETPLVNLINYASLIATKASRVCLAAQGDPVIEFGLRRTHGPSGGMIASRAAFLGGCESTSNTLAGKEYGIPVRGTVAHSWIMAFDNEMQAFQSFAQVMRDNAILLVDTYHTLQGVKNAITIGKKLREQNSDLLGIRLDSGDLNVLSKKARKLLDENGFKNTRILASGDLDEHVIAKLKKQKAPINSWGVGTRLTTAYDQPSLDAAYKLSAIRDTNGSWKYKIKLSDTPEKTTNPGIQQIRRYYQNEKLLGDVIYDLELGLSSKKPVKANREEDLLLPIFKQGKFIYQIPSLVTSREFCLKNITQFTHQKTTQYPVTLDSQLKKTKNNFLKNQ